MRRIDSDSSLDSHTDCEACDPLGLAVDPGHMTSCGESDRITEMALFSESFKKSSDIATVSATNTATAPCHSSEGFDSSGVTSQDVTLSEIRERTLEEKSLGEPKSKKSKRTKGASQRGVPMREEFFEKTGWTRSFIYGPADPLRNPLMVWCHICKRSFSIKTKGTMEILRHHRTEKHLRRDQR